MKSGGFIDRAVGQASGVLVVLGAIAMLLMMLHVVADVSGRYIFNHPLPGTLESVSYYYMVMVLSLPFAYVTRMQGQITVEMFTNWLPQRWIKLLDACAGVLTLVYVVVMAWQMGQSAVAMTKIGEIQDAGSFQMITWPTRWFPPVGLGVMACAVILRIVEDFRGFVRPS